MTTEEIPTSDSNSTLAPAISVVREQDRLLPIANVSRIMKKALPTNAKVAKDAREAMQECVSEFISFITSEASDKCLQEKRKTINGEDILWAMSALGFDKYIEPLKVYLMKYKEAVKGEKEFKGKGKKKSNDAKESPSGASAAPDGATAKEDKGAASVAVPVAAVPSSSPSS